MMSVVDFTNSVVAQEGKKCIRVLLVEDDIRAANTVMLMLNKIEEIKADLSHCIHEQGAIDTYTNAINAGQPFDIIISDCALAGGTKALQL